MTALTNIKQQFPILDQTVNDEPLIYFDNAATTQKPQMVIDRLVDYYQQDNANIHRGVHTLAERATASYESARARVAQFIKAASTKEVIFTKGTTQGLNWVAQSFAPMVLAPGDEILISPLEHHSNVVPWQQIAKRHGYQLRYLAMNPDGVWTKADLLKQITPKTKLLAITHVSNVLGTKMPIADFAEVMHANGGYIVVDGAQSVPHIAIDVQQLDVDFFCFSGHKMYGPTGIGVMYGKEAHLAAMEPIEFGGEMIAIVDDFDSTWAELPFKFEGGTQHIAGAIGLAAAIDFIASVGGIEVIAAHEAELTAYALQALAELDFITIYGSQDAAKHHSVISFSMEDVHPHDLATGLDLEGIAIRAGHHCAQPLMRRLNTGSTARVSFACYNSKAEIDQLIESLIKVKEFFSYGII